MTDILFFYFVLNYWNYTIDWIEGGQNELWIYFIINLMHYGWMRLLVLFWNCCAAKIVNPFTVALCRIWFFALKGTFVVAIRVSQFLLVIRRVGWTWVISAGVKVARVWQKNPLPLYTWPLPSWLLVMKENNTKQPPATQHNEVNRNTININT